MSSTWKPPQPHHPEAKALLETIRALNIEEPLYTTGTTQEVRAKYQQLEKVSRVFDLNSYNGIRRELFVPIGDSSDTIPIYVYQPTGVATRDAPIVVYFHGGGMVLGSRDSCEDACMGLSLAAKCVVVNVEYRLAPEHKFPIFIDDGCTVARWVLDNKTALGGNEQTKVGVAGDSAGGTIAASVAHDVKGLDFQVLIYPKLMSFCEKHDLQSYKEYKDDFMLSPELIIWLRELSLEPSQYADPRIAAFYRESFDRLPPTLFIVAECDPLRDESYEYAKKLKEAGVPYELHLIKGASHNFFVMPGSFPQLTHEANVIIADFIKNNVLRH